MRQHLIPANLVTSVSLTSGFLVLLAAPVHLGLATALVLLAMVLDGVDGALARRRGGDHTFGAQLDSLADLLCFCVAPAYALHATALAGLPLAGPVAACGFVLAGAWRLARFPLVQQQGHFVGLPTPAAGGVLMLLALWGEPVPALVGASVLAALMVSSLRVPTVLAAASSARSGGRIHAVRGRLRRRPPPLHPGVLARGRRTFRHAPARLGRRRDNRLLRALGGRGARRRGQL